MGQKNRFRLLLSLHHSHDCRSNSIVHICHSRGSGTAERCIHQTLGSQWYSHRPPRPMVQGLSLHRTGIESMHILLDVCECRQVFLQHLMFLLSLQSLTTPLQGFLNALVYGWTRSDFVRVGRSRRRKHGTHHSLEESLSSYDYSDDEKPTPTSSLVPGIDSGYFDRRNTGQGTPRSSRSDTGLSRTLPGRPRTRSGAGGSGRGREKGRGTSAASSWKSAESRLTSSDGCSADPSSWYQNKAGADIQGNGTG